VWREGKEWLLTLGSGFRGKGGAVLLYESHDLVRWTYRHPLVEGSRVAKSATNPVANGEMWECPDFFPLRNHHVLLISTMGRVLWKTGKYHDRRFTPEKEGVVDFGAYYAAKTMLDEHGNRILWGWIPECRPEAEYRAAGWAGVMALPRALSIGPDGELRMSPVPAVENLREQPAHQADNSGGDRQRSLANLRIHDLAGEIVVQFGEQRPFLLRLRSEKGESFAEIAYDPQNKDAELRVNNVTGAFGFAEPITLRILLDGSVLEVFANSRMVITARVYSVPSTPLLMEISGNTVVRLQAWQMRQISKDRLSSPAS